MTLARAYIGMGDIEGARDILNHLVQDGDSDALLLLQTLPPGNSARREHQPPSMAGGTATLQPAVPIPIPDGIDHDRWRKACSGDVASAQYLAGTFLRAKGFRVCTFLA